jgi:hypothetical protein
MFPAGFPTYVPSLLFLALPLAAQSNRTPRPIDSIRTVTMPGHVHLYAQPRYDQGRVASTFPLNDLICC